MLAQQSPKEEHLEEWKKNFEPEFEATDKEYKPIKDYWFKYLKNNEYFVFEHDEEILLSLNNISMGHYLSEDKEYEKVSLIFGFDENKFFTNKELKLSVSYTGTYVDKSVGTVIDWKNNPTVKYIKRRQKNKKTGEQRIVNQKVQERSFFQIFNNFEDEPEFDHKSQDKSDDGNK